MQSSQTALKPFPAAAGIRLSELIGALSHALDITEGQPEGHCIRCCWIGMHIGREIGVSNSVLDKAGKLDSEEWAAVKLHASYTETILSRIGAFSELARVAAAHHERLDGGGYPRGLMADAISLETRIITTADIFDAITAERPYRGAIPIPRTLEMMAETVGSAIDAQCFEALKSALARLS